MMVLSVCRHHHRSDNVHHHHRCLSFYAAGVLRQSRGHLLVGKLLVCLPVRYWVRRCQLFHHRGGDEEAQGCKGDSRLASCGLTCRLRNLKWQQLAELRGKTHLRPLLLQIPNSYNPTEAMAFDGCFHDNEIDLTPFPEVSSTPNTERNTQTRNSTVSAPTEGTRLRRKHPLRRNLSFIMSNSYMIDSYSRVLFPLAYLLFNIIYWSLYT